MSSPPLRVEVLWQAPDRHVVMAPLSHTLRALRSGSVGRKAARGVSLWCSLPAQVLLFFRRLWGWLSWGSGLLCNNDVLPRFKVAWCSGWMHVARKWLIPDTYSFFPIKTIYVKSLSNVTIPYTTGVVHETCWQECELGEIQNKLYPYPRVSQSGWRWLSNGDVSLRWGGCISSPCCSDWTLASLAWKSGTSGHPLLSKSFFFFSWKICFL